jgi:hypothetical protein
MKTSELTDRALDLAVAKAWQPVYSYKHLVEHAKDFNPSTNWAQGGPIIERERIEVRDFGGDKWLATDNLYTSKQGETFLIAAMRCYVASKLGDEVEIPEELK